MRSRISKRSPDRVTYGEGGETERMIHAVTHRANREEKGKWKSKGPVDSAAARPSRKKKGGGCPPHGQLRSGGIIARLRREGSKEGRLPLRAIPFARNEKGKGPWIRCRLSRSGGQKWGGKGERNVPHSRAILGGGGGEGEPLMRRCPAPPA